MMSLVVSGLARVKRPARGLDTEAGVKFPDYFAVNAG